MKRDLSVSDEQLVRAWCAAFKAGTGILEISEKLGINYKDLYRRFAGLRQIGVELPYLFGQRPRSLDKAKKLNAIIKAESKR